MGLSGSLPDLVVLVGVVVDVAVLAVAVLVVTAVDTIRLNVSFHLCLGVVTMGSEVGGPPGWGTFGVGRVVVDEGGNGVDVSIPVACAL